MQNTGLLPSALTMPVIGSSVNTVDEFADYTNLEHN